LLTMKVILSDEILLTISINNVFSNYYSISL